MSTNIADPPTLSRRTQPARAADDETIDLSGYLLAVWRRRWWVGGTGVVAAVIVAAVTIFEPRTYTSTTVLMVTTSKVGEEQASIVSASNFRPVIENRGIIQQTLSAHGLDRSPYSITPAAFSRDHLRVDEVRGTNLIRLHVSLPDPVVAAALANEMATQSIALARRLSQEEAVQARDEIGAQLPEAESNLRRAEDALEGYRRTAQVELLRKEVEALVAQRGDLVKLDVEIAAERAALSRGEQELAGRQELMTVRRTIDGDPALSDAARAIGGTSSVLGLRLESEVLNPVFEEVDRNNAASRIKLASLEKQRAEVLSSLKLDPTQLQQLTRLYEREKLLERLTMERDVARKIYEEVATRFQVARLQVAGRSTQLQIVDPAAPAQAPDARGTLGRALSALLIGLIAAILVVFAARAAGELRRADQADRERDAGEGLMAP